jgi:3'(2'), 5'-bisphosphate nucleotidase
MNDRQALALAIHAALDAGREIMEVYKTAPEVVLKEDRSPLTEADRRAHETIKSRLAGSPLPLLSEEGRAIPFSERKSWHDFWLVDPLDGTREFIRKNGEFTVNIARVTGGRPVAGVVYAPAKKLLYFALRGWGSFKARAIPEDFPGDGDPEALAKHSDALPLEKTNRPFTVVASRSHLSDETKAFVDELKKSRGEVAFLSSGSSLKICLVAEGAADVYPRLAPTMEWDTAAGHAVANEAGRAVRRYETGDELVYNKENLLNPWFVVE